jgi:glycosyltransferase involved in cell wall biosynthesis
MQKLTVIIPTNNESDNIGDLLDNVRWAAEIIIVDSFSTDDTVAIAKAKGATVLEHAYEGPAAQKNWVIPQAGNEWILLLDADERLTPELTAEIQSWLAREAIEMDAFWIGRQNHFLGKKIRYSGWQSDKVVRFFRRSCRYDNKQVHEEIITEGIRVSQLKNKMNHYTYKSVDHFLDKMRRYADWSADDHAAKTPRVTFFHLFIKPVFRFFKHYILKKGFLDGKEGLIVSGIMAWGVFLRYVKLVEKRRSSH